MTNPSSPPAPPRPCGRCCYVQIEDALARAAAVMDGPFRGLELAQDETILPDDSGAAYTINLLLR